MNRTGMAIGIAVMSWYFTTSTFGQCTTVNALTIPSLYSTSALVGNGNFNAIIFGNQVATAGDVEGRLAVGGSFSVNTGYSVGQATVGQNAPAGTDNFIVNNTFSNTSGINWGVRGNFIYATNGPGSTLPSHVGGGTTTQAPSNNRINFAPLKNYYVSVSSGLTALAPVGTSTVMSNIINLVGDGSARNYVFNVTLPSGILSGVTFSNIPVAGSTILINILNTTVSITGGSITNTDYRTKTLFNFPNATSVGLTSFLLEGSVLAPNANFTATGGGVNGQAVIGGNLLQQEGFEFHNFCLEQTNPLTVPDLTPIIYARNSTIYGTQPITVVVDVFEINNVATSGLITLKVSKDAKTSLSFDPTATSIGGRAVNNSVWTYQGLISGFYTLTTNQVIGAGDLLSFGFTGTLTPGATTGTLTVSTLIIGGSGGEVRINNNTDADKIDYFQQ